MDCIVIGNGESLARTPLKELARKYETFGCNRIHLFPFYPDHYVRVEPPQWAGSSQEFFDECRLHIAHGNKCYFPRTWQRPIGEHPNIEWIGVCHHYKYPHTIRKFPKAWHLPMPGSKKMFVCDTNAVTATMQVAVMKGATKIFLVGCDLIGNHFSPDDKGLVETERLLNVHETAKRSCPVPVFNATIGGALEIYPRIDVRELL